MRHEDRTGNFTFDNKVGGSNMALRGFGKMDKNGRIYNYKINSVDLTFGNKEPVNPKDVLFADVIDTRITRIESAVVTIEHSSPIRDIKVTVSEGDSVRVSYDDSGNILNIKGIVEKIAIIRTANLNRTVFEIVNTTSNIHYNIFSEQIRNISVLDNINYSKYRIYCQAPFSEAMFHDKQISVSFRIIGEKIKKPMIFDSTYIIADKRIIYGSNIRFDVPKALPSDVYNIYMDVYHDNDLVDTFLTGFIIVLNEYLGTFIVGSYENDNEVRQAKVLGIRDVVITNDYGAFLLDSEYPTKDLESDEVHLQINYPLANIHRGTDFLNPSYGIITFTSALNEFSFDLKRSISSGRISLYNISRGSAITFKGDFKKDDDTIKSIEVHQLPLKFDDMMVSNNVDDDYLYASTIRYPMYDSNMSKLYLDFEKFIYPGYYPDLLHHEGIVIDVTCDIVMKHGLKVNYHAFNLKKSFKITKHHNFNDCVDTSIEIPNALYGDVFKIVIKRRPDRPGAKYTDIFEYEFSTNDKNIQDFLGYRKFTVMPDDCIHKFPIILRREDLYLKSDVSFFIKAAYIDTVNMPLNTEIKYLEVGKHTIYAADNNDARYRAQIEIFDDGSVSYTDKIELIPEDNGDSSTTEDSKKAQFINLHLCMPDGCSFDKLRSLQIFADIDLNDDKRTHKTLTDIHANPFPIIITEQDKNSICLHCNLLNVTIDISDNIKKKLEIPDEINLANCYINIKVIGYQENDNGSTTFFTENLKDLSIDNIYNYTDGNYQYKRMYDESTKQYGMLLFLTLHSDNIHETFNDVYQYIGVVDHLPIPDNKFNANSILKFMAD